MVTFPIVKEVFTISVRAGAMCFMLAFSTLAGSGSNSHDLMVVLCMSFTISGIVVGVNELIFTEVSGALSMCLLSGSSCFSVTIILFILSVKNSLNSFAKSHSNWVGGNGNCLFLKRSLFVILKTALKLFLFSLKYL